MNFNDGTLDGACGVSILYSFGYEYGTKSTAEKFIPQGGCGWVSAGFVKGDKNSDKMFKWMSEQGDLMYKSPVKLNRNSKNKFYFALFDFSKGDKTAKYGYDHADGFEDDDV